MYNRKPNYDANYKERALARIDLINVQIIVTQKRLRKGGNQGNFLLERELSSLHSRVKRLKNNIYEMPTHQSSMYEKIKRFFC